MRIFFAVLGSFLVMFVLAGATTAVVARAVPALANQRGRPPRWYVVSNLLYSALFAWTGGYLVALMAPDTPRLAVLVLAIVTASLVAATSLLERRRSQPYWYTWMLLLAATASVYLGGRTWEGQHPRHAAAADSATVKTR